MTTENQDKEKRFCVCGDCLAIVPYRYELHAEEELCACGGVMCGCNFCNEEYAKHLEPILNSRI